MDGARVARLDRTAFVHRLADDVDDATKRSNTDGNHDRLASIGNFLSAREAFGRVHRDRANRRLAEMLRDFQHEAITLIFRLERVQNFGQVAVELHVDDGAHDLRDAPNFVGGGGSHCSLLKIRSIDSQFHGHIATLCLGSWNRSKLVDRRGSPINHCVNPYSASAPEMISISSFVIIA